MYLVYTSRTGVYSLQRHLILVQKPIGTRYKKVPYDGTVFRQHSCMTEQYFDAIYLGIALIVLHVFPIFSPLH